MDNIKQVKDMEVIVNKYVESMKLKDLFSSDFIEKYTKNKNLIDIIEDNSYLEKCLSQIDTNNMENLNKLIAKKTNFNDFEEMKKSAREYLLAERLKELNLL